MHDIHVKHESTANIPMNQLQCNEFVDQCVTLNEILIQKLQIDRSDDDGLFSSFTQHINAHGFIR